MSSSRTHRLKTIYPKVCFTWHNVQPSPAALAALHTQGRKHLDRPPGRAAPGLNAPLFQTPYCRSLMTFLHPAFPHVMDQKLFLWRTANIVGITVVLGHWRLSEPIAWREALALRLERWVTGHSADCSRRGPGLAPALTLRFTSTCSSSSSSRNPGFCTHINSRTHPQKNNNK